MTVGRGTREPTNGGWADDLAPLFGGLAGAFGGWLVLPNFVTGVAGFFGGAAWADPVDGPRGRIVLTCGSALLGAVSAYVAVLRKDRRRDAVHDAGAALGFRHAPEFAGRFAGRLERLLGGGKSVTLHAVRVRPAGDAWLVLCEATWPSGENATATRTVLCFEKPGLDLPEFALQPEGRLLRLLTDLAGLDDIDFEEAPEFSEAYHLSSADSARVRRLFTPDVLGYLAANTGLTVHGRGDHVAVLGSGAPVPSEDVPGFVAVAYGGVERLTRAALESP